jgi:4-hydroxy-4-methyl-2-oxoglutarate aldolase
MLTIHRGWQRPDPAVVARFAGAQTSHLADAMQGRGAVDWRIKPMHPDQASFVGVALTAYCYPADIAAMFGAIHEAQPGDVIMCACDGFTGTAAFGDIAAGMLVNKGGAAFVTDGLARDRAGIIATGLPVFAMGIVPNSPAFNGPGVVGAPVVLGGVHVRPGDVVVGDADGVVVIPQDRLEAVLDSLAKVRAAEALLIERVAAGLTNSDAGRRAAEAAHIIGG